MEREEQIPCQTVSVCIPAYNMARYLPFAIESVLRQEFQDYELVICDDASTDSTPDICRGYRDSRIRYLQTAGKSGQGKSVQSLLAGEHGGKLVTILHHDDYFLPGFLQDRVVRFESNHQLDFVFGAVQIIDAQGQTLSTSGRWKEDRLFGQGELLEPMLYGCILCPPSLMIRKSCLEKVGTFRTDLTWGPDWEWDLRLAERCAGYYCSEALAAYRVHDESGTAEQLNAAKNGPQERRILREAFDRLSPQNPAVAKLKGPVYGALSRRHMYFAGEALAHHRKSVARSNLWYAFLANYSMALRPTFWAMLLGATGPTRCFTAYRNLRFGRVISSQSVSNLNLSPTEQQPHGNEKLRGRRCRSKPKVGLALRLSVIVPTFNRQELVVQTLQHLCKKQALPTTEYRNHRH